MRGSKKSGETSAFGLPIAEAANALDGWFSGNAGMMAGAGGR
jgi:hypothetical protein